MKILYTTEGLVTGDRNGQGTSSDGKLEVTLALPKELGGSGKGTNPEQLFAVGYASCFMSALKHVAQHEKITVATDSTITSSVSLGANDDGSFGLKVAMKVHLPGFTESEALALVERAHQVCPYSKAIRNNLDVALSVTV